MIARKMLELFDPSDHWRLAGIVVAMVITGLLQSVGIASIMPFLAVVSNPTVISENQYLSWAYESFGFASTNSFIITLGIIFVITMVASNGLNTMTSWILVRFQWRAHRKLSDRLLQVYLRSPYAYHLNQNSARLGSTLLNQVSQVTGGLFVSAANIVSRGISSLFIVVLLVAVDPLLAVLVSLTIGGFYAAVYGLVRKKQGRLGAVGVAAQTERFQVVNEAFGGIKELKVLGREEHFLERFRGPSIRYARAIASHNLVGLLPRFALETLAYGGIVVVTLYLLQTRESLDQIFPLLAVYAFGANRLIPAVQELFAAFTKIRFQAPAVEELHADLYREGWKASSARSWSSQPEKGIQEEPAPVSPRAGESIRFDAVTFRYPGANRPALDHVSLEFPFNYTSGIVGATGSGKTTLIDLLLGLFEPMEGRILVGDRVLDDQLLPAWQQAVGYVPQSIFLCDASIGENIAFGIPPEKVDLEAVRRASIAAHLHDFVATLDGGYATIVGERGIRLSGGQRQRIGIARALYHDPAVLVMDEATSALDNVTEDVVMQAIRDLSRQRTILLIAHRLTTVAECDVIHVMEEGHVIASGRYDELVESSSAFRAMARI